MTFLLFVGILKDLFKMKRSRYIILYIVGICKCMEPRPGVEPGTLPLPWARSSQLSYLGNLRGYFTLFLRSIDDFFGKRIDLEDGRS
jgi:hypothetical protein